MHAQAFLVQLYAMRNQVDALILQLQAELGPGAASDCPHPDFEDAGSTLTETKRRCVRCKEIVP